MLALMDDETLLTTSDVAALTGRALNVTRAAIQEGRLPIAGRTDRGRPLVRRGDALRWHQSALRLHRPAARPWLTTADTLREYEPASATELAILLDLDPGTVRKHLAILAAQGLAERLSDRQWTTVASATAGAA